MTATDNKKILLVTRPIAPPWDEASKNFAYYLAKNITGQEFYLLTNGIIPNLPDQIRQKPIYTSNDFTYFQKLRLIKHLRKMRHDFDIFHYVFTPTKQNTFLLKSFVCGRKNDHSRSIQTIATLREDLYCDREIKDLIFGDLVVTYSDYAKNKLNQLGFQNVKRIYPGIDLEYYSPEHKDEKMLSQFKIKNSEFVVTYPGEYTRLGATDDILNLILSNINLWKQYKIKFVFACRVKNSADVRKKEEVLKKLEESNCADLVIFTDTFSDMAKLYNLSDIVIFPVRDMKGKFDVPLVILEAMACEKPIIISDLPIFREFATAENSVTIKSGDAEQLKNSIVDLYQSEETRERIGKSARAFVQERFDIKKVAEIYRKIYEKL